MLRGVGTDLQHRGVLLQLRWQIVRPVSGDQPLPFAPSISASLSAGGIAGERAHEKRDNARRDGAGRRRAVVEGCSTSSPGRPGPKFPKKRENAATFGFCSANMPGPCDDYWTPTNKAALRRDTALRGVER
jgi:hypothetical protein